MYQDIRFLHNTNVILIIACLSLKNTPFNYTNKGFYANLIFSYHSVIFSDPPFLNGTQRTVNSSDEQELIDNLHPGVNYNFTVTALNESGSRLMSDPLLVTTQDEGIY